MSLKRSIFLFDRIWGPILLRTTDSFRTTTKVPRICVLFLPPPSVSCYKLLLPLLFFVSVSVFVLVCLFCLSVGSFSLLLLLFLDIRLCRWILSGVFIVGFCRWSLFFEPAP